MMRPGFALLALAACTSSPAKTVAPTLEVTTPARGTTVDGGMVTVSGTATASGAMTVTVDGEEVPVGKDGSFSTQIAVQPGIQVIETHAIDRAGHDVRDTRAVLAGTLAQSDGSHTSAIAARASAAALTTIGKAIASDAKGVDYTQAAQGLNPIYNNTGCLGAVIDITSISIGNVSVGLVPKAGALATDVTIDNVVVKLKADFKVACIGGSTTITVSASAAHISGDLGARIASGTLATSLPSASVQLDNFDLQVSGVPSEIVDLFNSHVQGAVQSSLASMIQSKVPPIANAKLAGLLAGGFDEKLLGVPAKLSITPSTVTVSPSGLYVAVDTKLAVTGGSGGMFLTTQSPVDASLMSGTRGLGVAIACDVLNELLAGLWAAGAFDTSVPVSSLSVLAALLDPDATTIAVSLSLPPTVSSDGTGNLQLAIGDAMISVEDQDGNVLQKLALTLETALSAQASQGSLALSLGQPQVWAQVLDQADDGSRPLGDSQVEGLVTGVWGVVGNQAQTALAKLSLPSVAGVQLGAPTISAVQSYVVADVPLD